MDNELSVVDNQSSNRYEARDGDTVMGFVTYRRTDKVITFLHSETLPEFQGRGVAGKIAAKSLDDARAAGLKVRPACPYYVEYLKKHHDWDDLVVEAHHK